MKRSILGVFIVLLTLLVCVFVTPMMGQQVTSSLTGIVTDSSAARIVGAAVTMTNEASGDARRSQTNSEGYFSIVGIMPGSYSVLIEAHGFSSAKISEIKLTAGDNRTLGQITLSVAAAEAKVTVNASVSELATVDSGEKSVALNTKQFEEIQILGRSALEYLKLLPGTADITRSIANRPAMDGQNMGIDGNGLAGPQSGIGWVSINGIGRESTEISMDGIDVSDPGCNCSTPVNPNPDMISEMKVQQSNFSAENAKGPVVINSISKAGGKDFHGSAYLHARDYVMNSNDALNNTYGQGRPPDRYLFPGGTLGGPVLLPGTNFNRNRDKLFFFAGFEYFAQRLDSGLLESMLPTAAMKSGDFSDQATMAAFSKVNPNAGTSIATKYPGGIVPVTQLDPGMTALMKLLPPPNMDPTGIGNGYNWRDESQGDQNMKQILVRGDYSISDYTKLFVRYNHQDLLQPVPVAWWCCASGEVLTPSKISNPTRSDSAALNFTKVFSPTLTNETVMGIEYQNEPAYYDDINALRRTTVGYPYKGIFGVDDLMPSFSAGTGVASILLRGLNPTWFTTKHLYTIANNTSKIVGTHTVKFGFYWSQIMNKEPDGGLMMANVSFSTGHSSTTGNVMADMMLGNANSYSENTAPVVMNQGWWEASGFVQDSWKVRRNLTIEYGVRMQHMEPWTARNQFGTATWVQSEYSSSAPYASLPGVDWHSHNNNISPAGWATQPVYWAPRVGAAWDIFSNGRTVLRGGFGTFMGHDPALAGSAMDLPAGMRNITVSPNLNLRDMDSISATGNLTFGATAVDSTDNREPTTKSYSVTLSNRLTPTILWETAYVGSKSTNLVDPGDLADINQVRVGAMINNPAGNPDNYRPMSQYSSLSVPTHGAYSNYNALQTMLTKQAGRISLTASYTWSKAMGIVGSTVDNLTMNNNYGVLGFDRTNIFSASYVYKVPDLIKGGNAFVRGVGKDWTVSGQVQWDSGVNLQQMSTNLGLNYQVPGTTRTIGGTDIMGTNSITAMPILTCNPVSNLASHQYINGSCFAPPVAGSNGDLGVNGSLMMPYMRGPDLFNSNLSLSREFKIMESRSLEFSFSSFNFLNHPNASFIGGDQNLNLSFNAQGKLTNPNFGYATHEVGNRTVELSVKFRF